MKITFGKTFTILTILTGILLLNAGLGWNSLVLPRVNDIMVSRGNGDMNITSDDPDKSIMEGRIGLMSLIWDGMEGRSPLEPGQFPTREMFETEWRDVKIIGEGLVDADSGEPLFDSFENSFTSTQGESFPVGGVERTDYEIFNAALGRTVKVRYMGEEIVQGKIAFVYRTNITEEPISSVPSSFGSDLSGGNDSPLPFDGEMEYLYTDHTTYFLDPATSIPLNLKLGITSAFVFPDSSLLQVQNEQVQYSEETIWLPSSTIPGKMDGQEVIKETVTSGKVFEEDPMVAIYEVNINYYDASTGESLEGIELQGTESFAVDRETYMYIPGYQGTSRSGYYQFPIGNVQKRDYPMWDEALQTTNPAVFMEETTRAGQRVYRYRMTTEDVVVDSGNAILPIYYHPGTEYTLDTVQDWYIDAGTGMMLDMTIDGTIYVSTPGPFGIIDQSVGSFNVDLPDNTTDILLEVSRLYRNLLLPLSGEPINVFSMELQFTEEMQRELVDISDQVALIFNILEVWAPMILMVIGTVILIATTGILLFIRTRRRKEETVQVISDVPLPQEGETYNKSQ